MAALSTQQVARFERLLHAFAAVERVAHISNRQLRENDAEHSYFVAMLSWYIADTLELSLNRDLLIRYGLIHDLVEVYAGDTYIFDTEGVKTKHAREAAAAKQLLEEFPEFAELHTTIERYEAQSDPESRFVKALDKVEPLISSYIQNGRTWKEMRVPFDTVVAHKREKVGQQQEIRELLEAFIACIEERKEEFFPRYR